jgi:hypothetical protein
MRRRDLLSGGAAGAALLVAANAHARGGNNPNVPTSNLKPGSHAPVPLPFKSNALDGITDTMIGSHHDKNYAGAVKNLNKVENDLAALGKARALLREPGRQRQARGCARQATRQ